MISKIAKASPMVQMMSVNYNRYLMEGCYWTSDPVSRDTLFGNVYRQINGNSDEWNTDLWMHLMELDSFDLVQEYLRNRRLV